MVDSQQLEKVFTQPTPSTVPSVSAGRLPVINTKIVYLSNYFATEKQYTI
jgi:hypothetical protein